MTRTLFFRAWLIAAAAAVAVVPSDTLLANSSAPPKKVICGLMGCPGGTQKCVDIHAELSDPLIGKFSVTVYCTENGPPDEGGEDVT